MPKYLTSAEYHGPFEGLLEKAEGSLTKAGKELKEEGYDCSFVEAALEAVQRASDIYQEELARFEMRVQSPSSGEES